VTFKTFSVRQFLNGRRKNVPSRWPSEREAALAEFQPCSWLFVAEAAGGPKSCTTAEVIYTKPICVCILDLSLLLIMCTCICSEIAHVDVTFFSSPPVSFLMYLCLYCFVSGDQF